MLYDKNVKYISSKTYNVLTFLPRRLTEQISRLGANHKILSVLKNPLTPAVSG
jgi:hypothetical protein